MATVAPRIDRYELRREVACTETSTVYDGWDSSLSRRVAVKIINIVRFGHAEVQNDLARFRQGARAAGRLVHPNIAGIYDYGETDQRAYLVMEFIDGPTLQDLFNEGRRFDLNEIASIISSILRALQYSHDQNIVHRDIKPGNVMFTAEGTVKLTDFGIARIENSDVTVVGTIMGTPAYMSPEQFLGEKVDWRSDIYSVGVTLYHLLTGERPFEGNLTTIMHKVLYTTPPLPSRLSSMVNASLDEVVGRAMARYRDDRFETCDDFHTALQIASTQSRRITRPAAATPADVVTEFHAQTWRSSVMPKPPVREPRRHLRYRFSDLLSDRTRLAAVAGCTAVALVTGAGLAWLGTREPPRRMAEATTPPALAVSQPAARPEPPNAPLPSVAAPTPPASSGPSANQTEIASDVAAATDGQVAMPRIPGQPTAPDAHNDVDRSDAAAASGVPLEPPRARVAGEQPPAAEKDDGHPVTAGPAVLPPSYVRKDERRPGAGRTAEGPPSTLAARENAGNPRGSGEPPSIRPPSPRAVTPGSGSTLPSWLSKMTPNAGQDTGAPPPANGAATSSVQPAPEIANTSASVEIGLLCRSVTAEAGANLGLESAKGMEVIGVTSGGAASQAGIRRHDVILSIAGIPMRDLSGLSKLADNLSEQRVPVELWRDGKRQVVQLDLARMRR